MLVADKGAIERPHGTPDAAPRPGRGREARQADPGTEPGPPGRPGIEEMRQRKPDDPRVDAYGRLLYDQAVIAEGSRIKDPAAFAKRVNELIAGAAGTGNSRFGRGLPTANFKLPIWKNEDSGLQSAIRNPQSAIRNRQSAIGNRQSAILLRPFKPAPRVQPVRRKGIPPLLRSARARCSAIPPHSDSALMAPLIQ